jgi:hypothetical protein
VALIAGLALAIALLLHFLAAVPIWIVPILGVFGGMTLLIGLAGAITAAHYARLHDQLRAGIDRIAGWTIDPERWHAFLELNERLNAVPGNTICRIDSQWQRCADSVEFMAGRDALLIGDEIHPLPARGSYTVRAVAWLEGPPPCIELIITSHGKHVITFSLRVPVAPGAESDAMRVLEHFRTRISPPPRMNIFRRRKGALVFAAIMAVSTAVCAVLLRGASNQARGFLLIGTFASGLFCVTSLFIAWVLHNWIKHPLRSSQLGESPK